MDISITPQFPEALTWPERVKGITITDQASYDLAAGIKLDLTALRKRIVEEFAPMKEAAHRAHKAITSKEAEYLAPITQAEGIIVSSLKRFMAEQERIQQEAQRKLDQERREAEEADRQRRIEEARQLRAAEEARLAEIRAREEAMRLENATTMEDLETPVFAVPEVAPVEAFIAPAAPVVRLVAPPTFDRVKGLGIRKAAYKGRVVDMRRLAAAVAAGTAPESFLMANQVAINARVKSDGRDFSVPGIELYEE